MRGEWSELGAAQQTFSRASSGGTSGAVIGALLKRLYSCAYGQSAGGGHRTSQ